MIPRARALYVVGLMVIALIAERARAGVWATEPSLGLQTDYSSNPSLRVQQVTSTVDGAVLVDVPTTYTANGWIIAVQPTVRYTDTSGYTSLNSNYEHLTASAELDTERNSVKLTGLAQRDSSAFQDYNANGSVGVRQDTGLADVTWISSLTERTSATLDVSCSRVRYGYATGESLLNDYTYWVAAPALSWQAGERSKLTVLGSFSSYDSLSGITRSRDTNVELGFSRQLNEYWTASLEVGVSRVTDSSQEYFGPFYLGTFRSTTDGTVFSGNLTRQGPRWTTTLTASRSLAPSGFAFLSRSDVYGLQANYALSARWMLQGYVRRRTQDIPEFAGQTIGLSYTDVGATASWLFTEHWTISFNASHVSEAYAAPAIRVAESGFSLQLTRKFNRIEWH